LYAFKGTHFTSTAYKASVARHPTTGVVRASLSDRQSVSPTRGNSEEELKVAQQRPGLTFEAAPHPIGAVWQSPITEVAATTELDPSRNAGAITITIERRDNKNVGTVYAPFAQALAIAKDPKEIPALIGELRQKSVEMVNNVARFGSGGIGDPRSAETRLFPVKQPIVFVKADGSRVCFLAPTYSPVAIGPNLLSCDPTQAFPLR
jgi:hypothetical protein